MLPFIKIQSDWELTNKGIKMTSKGSTKPSVPTTFWISSYSNDHKEGIHGTYAITGQKVSPASPKSGLYKEEPTDFRVTVLDKLRLHISCPKTMTNTIVLAPRYRWTDLHSKYASAISLDIDPTGAWGASGGSNGSVRVWNALNGILSRDLKTKGHVAEVNVVKWFPNGKVLCSAGSDLQIKIWSVENSKCVRSYSGHSRSIEGISMIGRGRNFISCSHDGTSRLWDAGKGAVSTFVTHDDAINDCHIVQGENLTSDGQLVLLSCEDGYLLGYDLRQKQQAFKIDMGNAVNCCSDFGPNTVATGLHNGQICVADLRHTTGLLGSYSKSDAPIFDIHLHPTQNHQTNTPISLWVANGEGDCSLFKIPIHSAEETSQSQISCELSGVNSEHVTAVTGSKSSLFTASRDGICAYDRALVSIDSVLQNEFDSKSSTSFEDGKEEEKDHLPSDDK